MGWLAKNINLHEKEMILYDTDDIERDEEGNYLIDIAYRRVSTTKQVFDGYGLDVQLEKIVSVCERLGSKACILITDDGYTGTVLERPGLQTFIKRLENFNAGLTKVRIRRFIVPRIDRLARSLYRTLEFIQSYILPMNFNLPRNQQHAEQLSRNRFLVEFYSENEEFIRIEIDKYGKVDQKSMSMLTLYALFAQIDRDNTVAKLIDGKVARITSGYPMGGGNTPYGYKYVEKSKDYKGNYETIPEQKAKVREARRLFVEEHLPPATIQKMLGFTTERLVINILKNRTYLNIIKYKGKEYPGHFEPFITEEEYEEQMDEFARRARGYSDSCYMLTSLMYCGNCGAKIRYQKDKTGLRCSCYSKEKSKPHLVKDPNCPNTLRYWADDIEGAVIQQLFALSFKNNEENKKTVSNTDIILEMENNISKKQNAMLKATRLAALAENETEEQSYRAVASELSRELEDLVEQLEKEKKKQFKLRKIEKAQATIGNLKDAWQHMSDEDKRNICRQVIDRVVITHQDIGKPRIDVYFQLENYLNK